jgi:hypothetical protein
MNSRFLGASPVATSSDYAQYERGGVVYLYNTQGGTVTIDSSTISGNNAALGGGIFFYGANDPIVINDSTIAKNRAAKGGGIYLYSGTLTINFSTISGNSSSNVSGYGGGGIYANSPVDLNNSIVADNTAYLYNPDISGNSFTLNYSLVENPDTAGFTGTGAITGQDPQLGPLQNNGGPTQTEAPAPTSPVIDKGDPAYVPPPATDQRGAPRKGGTRVDMGAVELVNGGTIQLSSPTYSIAENGGSVLSTITRTGTGTLDAASVDYATSPGTATAGADYTTTSGTANFAAGATTATFSVPILDDQLIEGNETFNVTLTNPSPGSTLGAQSSAVVTITDFEEGKLQFASSTGSVQEDGGSIGLTVNRVNGSDGAVSVNVVTSNGTASAGSDYTATSVTLNWAAGDSAPKTVPVPILDDNIVEGNETFNATLNTPTGGAQIGSPATETVTIVDVEGSVQFSVASTSIPEPNGPVVITVTRGGTSTGAASVQFTTANGTATAPSDYATTTGTLTWAAGDLSPKTISIPIVSDQIPEPPETFTVTLSNAVGVTIGAQDTTSVTITPPPSEIPVLGSIGKLVLALVTAFMGLFVIDRKRLFTFFFTALLIGAMAGAAVAQTPSKWTKTKSPAPMWTSGTLSSVTSKDGNITFTLEGGKTVTVPEAKVNVVDVRTTTRTRMTPSALKPGMHVHIVQRFHKGVLRVVKVKIGK